MILPIWLKPALIGTVLVIGGGALAWQVHSQSAEIAALAQANQQHGAAVIQEQQADTQHQAVEAQKPIIVMQAANTSRLEAELAALRASLPVDQSPLVAKQDELIQAQKVRISGLETQIVNLTAEGESRKAEADRYKAEAVSLRTVIAHTPQPHSLGVGLLYGTNKTMGVWVEYDIQRLRVGVDVISRPIQIVGQTNLEAVGRVGWRF